MCPFATSALPPPYRPPGSVRGSSTPSATTSGRPRLERGLFQGQIADEFGITAATLGNWERNRTKVQTRLIAKVVAFLGYDPREETGSVGQRIRVLRERQGLSQEALAAKLGVNASTVNRWERGRVQKLFPAVRKRFEEFLAGG